VRGRKIGLCPRIRAPFIRSVSATPFISRALKPQDGSSSSSLTSTNVSVLISPQPHTRKVTGSIPVGTTKSITRSRACDCRNAGAARPDISAVIRHHHQPPSPSSSTNTNVSFLTSPQLHTRKVGGSFQPRRGVVGSRFASPHPVRRSLTKLLQSPALFGGVLRCARSDCRRLTPHIIKLRQISFPQVGHSHNPLVAGSSPARPTSEAIFGRRS
jgi:hypothetical protein